MTKPEFAERIKTEKGNLKKTFSFFDMLNWTPEYRRALNTNLMKIAVLLSGIWTTRRKSFPAQERSPHESFLLDGGWLATEPNSGLTNPFYTGTSCLKWKYTKKSFL